MTFSDSNQTTTPDDVEKRQLSDDGGSDVNGAQEELPQLDRAKEIKLLAKLDLAFIPVIMLVYLSCFLDRANIGLFLFSTTGCLMLSTSQAT
jgi:hypothetical protein